MNCADCGSVIPSERLAILPHTEHCVKCADRHSVPVVARMIYSHKTAGEVVFATGRENIRRLNREYSRGR